MENIKQTVNGNILTLEVDLSKRGEISKTGKTIRIASSEGNKRISGTEIFFGLNVYTKKGI